MGLPTLGIGGSEKVGHLRLPREPAGISATGS